MSTGLAREEVLDCLRAHRIADSLAIQFTIRLSIT